jgi:hypothetical protein
MLQDTSAQVTQLRDRRLAYASVAQAIVGCSSEIDRYLADYSVVFYFLKIVCMYSLFRFVSCYLKCKFSTTSTKCGKIRKGKRKS